MFLRGGALIYYFLLLKGLKTNKISVSLLTILLTVLLPVLTKSGHMDALVCFGEGNSSVLNSAVRNLKVVRGEAFTPLTSFVKATLLTNAFMCKWTLLSEHAGGVVSCVRFDTRQKPGFENRGNPENVNPWELAKIPGRTSFSKVIELVGSQLK